jgi:hypothetical protein
MRSVLLMSLVVVSFFLITSCGEKQDQSKVESFPEQKVDAAIHTVTVEEKIDASNYSYLKVNENNNSYWIAVPQMEVKSGDVLVYSKYMEMRDFKSETLNKTFESVLFVDDARPKDSNTQVASPHSNIGTKKDEAIKIEPLKGGYSIEDIFSKKASLKNKTVKVKGKVVKVNENIMGVNWIHIQDGTGSEGTHDLLITSESNAQVGQVIVAEGILSTDKDFGSGYFYSVLLENSKISIQ